MIDLQVVQVELLREMLDELKAIHGLLRPQSRSHDDLRILRKLLPGIRGEIGSTIFSTAELLESPIFRALLPDMTSRKIGSLFSRYTNVDVGGLCIERRETEHHLRLWCVVQMTPRTPQVASSLDANGR